MASPPKAAPAPDDSSSPAPPTPVAKAAAPPPPPPDSNYSSSPPPPPAAQSPPPAPPSSDSGSSSPASHPAPPSNPATPTNPTPQAPPPPSTPSPSVPTSTPSPPLPTSTPSPPLPASTPSPHVPTSTPSPHVPNSAPRPASNPPPPSSSSNRPPPLPSGGASSSPRALSPPSGGSPSKLHPSKKSTPSPTSNDVDSNLPLVLGVSLGVGVFLVMMIISVLLCAKKKKKKPVHGMQYDNQSPQGGYYNGGGQIPKWQNGGPQGMDANGNLPPPPGTAFSPAGQWAQSPIGPLPPTVNNSEASSGNSGQHGSSFPPASPGVPMGFSKNSFTYEELAAATNGFCSENLLGQGGFGYVHKGVLPNGMEVAVKQLKMGSGQGEREFQAEVEIISRVHHRHLVSLVGYCIAGDQRMLVYEFVPNNTLEYHLHAKGHPTMDWSTRLRIAIGSAKGLAYLHEDCHPRIIHRDIKTANILLDSKFEAMVADFGLAKFTSDTNTHVSTRIMGTFGYLAPEYASTGKVTEKSDVFSFGVMLLELITGRRPIDNTSDTSMEESLVDWARPILNQILAEENFDEVADPNLENNYDKDEMARMIASAAACTRHSARKRPKMSQIVRALEGDVSPDDLNVGAKPARSRMASSGSEYESGTHSTMMRQFRKVALESNEFSNDYSDGTSSGEISTAGSRRMEPPNI